jgi:hypothetical protein
LEPKVDIFIVAVSAPLKPYQEVCYASQQQVVLQQSAKDCPGERTISSTNGAGKIRYPHTEE